MTRREKKTRRSQGRRIPLAKDPLGPSSVANDKCPLPKAKWGTFSAGPSSPGANPKTKLANAAFSCSKKEAGERGILGSTGGEAGGDGKRQSSKFEKPTPPDAQMRMKMLVAMRMGKMMKR